LVFERILLHLPSPSSVTRVPHFLSGIWTRESPCQFEGRCSVPPKDRERASSSSTLCPFKSSRYFPSSLSSILLFPYPPSLINIFNFLVLIQFTHLSHVSTLKVPFISFCSFEPLIIITIALTHFMHTLDIYIFVPVDNFRGILHFNR
jgi:hypothetical protein